MAVFFFPVMLYMSTFITCHKTISNSADLFKSNLFVEVCENYCLSELTFLAL